MHTSPGSNPSLCSGALSPASRLRGHGHGHRRHRCDHRRGRRRGRRRGHGLVRARGPHAPVCDPCAGTRKGLVGEDGVNEMIE